MSDRTAILEALARAIHCHDGRLPTPWDADMIARWPDDCEYERKVAMSQAAAVLELVGPRKLVWAKIHWENYTSRPYLINIMHWPDTPTDHKLYIEKDDGDNFLGNFPTIEAAKSAAQAHADAAHWKNTKIGGE
jgi:hypothetical protein